MEYMNKTKKEKKTKKTKEAEQIFRFNQKIKALKQEGMAVSMETFCFVLAEIFIYLFTAAIIVAGGSGVGLWIAWGILFGCWTNIIEMEYASLKKADLAQTAEIEGYLIYMPIDWEKYLLEKRNRHLKKSGYMMGKFFIIAGCSAFLAFHKITAECLELFLLLEIMVLLLFLMNFFAAYIKVRRASGVKLNFWKAVFGN